MLGEKVFVRVLYAVIFRHVAIAGRNLNRRDNE